MQDKIAVLYIWNKPTTLAILNKKFSLSLPRPPPPPHPYTHELDAFGFSVSLSLIPRGGGVDILVLHTVLSTDGLSCSNPESVLVYWLSTREVNMITHIYEADINRLYFSRNRVKSLSICFLITFIWVQLLPRLTFWLTVLYPVVTWKIPESLFSSVSKQVLEQNLSYVIEFDVQHNELTRKSHFHLKGCAPRLVLKQR